MDSVPSAFLTHGRGAIKAVQSLNVDAASAVLPLVLSINLDTIHGLPLLHLLATASNNGDGSFFPSLLNGVAVLNTILVGEDITAARKQCE